MAKLVLVKHAPPEIASDIISERWVLSEEGRRRCDWLADELKLHGVSRLYSSLQPKALETAALVAMRNGFALEPRTNLHEDDRTGLGFVTQNELEERIKAFFEQPDRIIIGNETAHCALRRFAEALGGILAEGHDQNIAIVTHGTVLSLFVAHHNAIATFDLWKRLRLPSYVLLDATTFFFDGEVHNHSE